jgi:hypothetical protein
MVGVGVCDAVSRRRFQQRRRRRVNWTASAKELDEGLWMTGHD